MTGRKQSSNLDLNNKRLVAVGAPTVGTDGARKSDVDTAEANAKSRTNHTGTQLASTISDFDTQVRTNRLDQMAAPTNPVPIGGQKLTGVGDPTVAQDAATKAYVDAQMAGLSSGQILKGSVRVVAKTNIVLATPGATIDGATMVSGDIVLLAGQSTGSQNGPYVWTGAAAALTRATNWDSQAKAVVGSYWIIREGTEADNFALMTNDSFTLNTSVATFRYIGVAAASTPAFEQDLGDGTATTFTLTHNFGTRNVIVRVTRVASPYDEIDVYVAKPTVNTVSIEPDEVWSSAQFHAVISKQ